MEVLVPHISCVVTEGELPEAVQAKYGEIYVLSGKGIFKQIRLKGGRTIRFQVESIPGYVSALTEEMNFLPAGKIPFDMLEQLIEFFKSVMTIKKCDLEAMAHILWSPEEGYHIAVPNQTISKASVTYDWTDYLKPNDIIVLDIHSHNTMGAFFSGTDNNDDKKIIAYSGVVGQLDKPTPALVWRFNINERNRPATMEEIFDVPKKEVSINPEWMEKVKTGPAYGSGYAGMYRGGGAIVPFQNGRGQNGGVTRDRFPNGQRKFEGMDDPREFDMKDWLHNYTNEGAPEPEDNSGYNPKTGTIPVQDSRPEWARMSESRFEVEAEVKERAKTNQRAKDLSPGEDDYFIAEHGKDIADAKQNAEVWIDDLDQCDEALLSIVMYAYDKMTEKGQTKLMTEGL